MVEPQRSLADREQYAGIRVPPFEDVVDVQDQIRGAGFFVEAHEAETVDMHVMPRHRIEVFGAPRATVAHCRLASEMSPRRRGRSKECPRETLPLCSTENMASNVEFSRCGRQSDAVKD